MKKYLRRFQYPEQVFLFEFTTSTVDYRVSVAFLTDITKTWMTCFGIRSLQRWKKQEPQLRDIPKYKLRGRMRIRQKGVGKFPRVDLSLLEEIKRRRFKADPYYKNWIKSRMKQLWRTFF